MNHPPSTMWPTRFRIACFAITVLVAPGLASASTSTPPKNPSPLVIAACDHITAFGSIPMAMAFLGMIAKEVSPAAFIAMARQDGGEEEATLAKDLVKACLGTSV